MIRPLKLNEQDAQEIAARLTAGEVTETEIAREYGVARGTVHSIVTGSYWSGALAQVARNTAETSV